MAKDVVTFLVWAGEPHLEARHKTGFKAIIYLIILLTLVYLSKKKVWSRFDNKKDLEEDVFDKAAGLIDYFHDGLFTLRDFECVRDIRAIDSSIRRPCSTAHVLLRKRASAARASRPSRNVCIQ